MPLEIGPLDPVDAISTIAGYNMSSKAQKEANWSNAQQAHDARIWAENMRATQHQATVSDLRKAGLNPILSATHGVNPTPASSPARMESHGHSAAQAGREFAMKQHTMKNLKEQNVNIDADTDLKRAMRARESQQYNTLRAQEGLLVEQAGTERENQKAAMHTAEILSHSAKGARLEGEIDETRYGAIMRYIDRAIKAITGTSGAVRNVK